MLRKKQPKLKVGDAVQRVRPHMGLKKGVKGHIDDIRSGNYIVEWFDWVRLEHDYPKENLSPRTIHYKVRLCEDDCNHCQDRFLCFTSRHKPLDH